MILVVGLSPAWQRTLWFASFAPGRVNRAVRVSEMASGKGVNVARVARQLGARVRLLTVAGGARGRRLAAGLPPSVVVRVRAETRMCQTLIAGGGITELVEEAGALSRAEVAAVWRQFERLQARARWIVLSGSVPAGCGEDFYARLIRRARAPVLVDAHGRPLVHAMRARPFLLKVNRDEFRAGAGAGAEWAVISDGARPVEVRHGRQRWTVTPPRVRAVNTIGSGDAMMAGLAVALARGAEMPEAVRFGVACGTANALTERPGFVNPADVKRFLRKVSRSHSVGHVA
jgi:tagatose 6-phosphate kinase